MGDKHPTNAERKQFIDQQSYLCDDLIIQEILTRLPVKSILRFKSVSRQWYSTLSSSNFANAHLNKSPFPHPSAPVKTLFIKSRTNYYHFSFEDDDQISGNFEDNMFKLDVDLGVENKEYLQFIGCSHGLICLTIFSHPRFVSNSDDGYLILWNPATRKLHRYESDGYLMRNGDRPFVARGFGENKWRKIEFAFDKFIVDGRAALIDEKLYWESISMGGDSNVIVSFNLEVERFEIFQYNLEVLDDFNSVLGVMGECFLNRGDNVIHILESPTRMKSICLPKGLLLDFYSEMIGFTKTGKIFVTGRFSRDVVWYKPSDCRRTLQLLDVGTKPMQHSILMEFNGPLNIAKYVPSLASPFPIG